MVARAAVSTVTINRLLGFETYLPTPDNSKMIKAPAIDSTRPDGWETRAPSHSLLELPAEVAAQGYDCFDLSMLHLPSVERAYLADVRAAFEDAGVEIFQLLIDTGEIGSPDAARKQRRHHPHQVLDRAGGRSWALVACAMCPAIANRRPKRCARQRTPSASSLTSPSNAA